MTADFRPARPDELDRLVDLCSSKRYPTIPGRNIPGEVSQQEFLQTFRTGWGAAFEPDSKWSVLLRDDPAGYVVLLNGMQESITGDPQSLLYDHYGELEPALSVAKAEAAARDSDYVVLHVFEGLDRETLRAQGFQPELTRISRRVERFEQPPSRFLVRPARPADRLFVLWLNQVSVDYVKPGGREWDLDEVHSDYFSTYMDLTLEPDDPTRVLIIEDREAAGRTQMGYLMLKLNFDGNNAYIYDLAVHKDYWGRRATQYLMRAGENYLADLGVEALVGDISEENPRALKTALKSLSFTIESQRWGARVKQ